VSVDVLVKRLFFVGVWVGLFCLGKEKGEKKKKKTSEINPRSFVCLCPDFQ